MRLKSISGIEYKVSDLNKTAAFYEALGFRPGKQNDGILTVYLNWFWVEFRQGEIEQGGPAIYLSVEDIDDFYAHLDEMNIKASGQPVDTTGGRRELVITDPDGYKLVLFEKK